METMNSGNVAAADQEECNGTATIVVESWDTEEPIADHVRNPDELAPPSYMDIAQSFNSNCPSFFSHDDHNEAPPTYEETCAGFFPYGSETSLTHLNSQPSERSPSPARTGQQGFFQNDPTFAVTGAAAKQPCRSSNKLCPSSAAAGLSQRHSENTASNQNCKNSQCSSEIAPDNTLLCQSALSALVSSPDSNTAPEESRDQTSQWSRRSFSSIPSYTCLLSESGEVSAQVFNTSSIIEEMMPAGDSVLRESSNIPTRSHSMSSVHVLRQGVPYSNLTTSYLQSSNQSCISPQLPHQPVYDQSISAMPGRATPCSSNNSSSTRLNSPTYHHPQLRKASDSNILDLLGIHSGSTGQQGHFTEFCSTSSLGKLQGQMVESHELKDSPLYPGLSSEPQDYSMRENKISAESQHSIGHSNVLDVQETI
ncbi:hypothetical protein Btru_008913 [Bulinus truncatus]|nr:hypothetical protein Btru_008913 [Bulinus truncatus]